MLKYMKETFLFITNAVSSFRDTGSLFPTSRWAAEALTSPLRAPGLLNRPKRKILELGPGTGSVTVQILKDMRDDDELLICELNPKFMKVLQDSLKDNYYYRKHQSRISFFLGPAQELPEDKIFDVIVCALPFLNFDFKTASSIFEKIKKLSNDDTLMTYYQYIGMKKLGALIPERREKLKKLLPVFDSVSQAQKGKKRIWLNMLPVDVFTMKPSEFHKH